MSRLWPAVLAAAMSCRGAVVDVAVEPKSKPANMNGAYALTNTPKQVPGKFPINYADYPGGAEYFDVYSPPVRPALPR